MDTQNLELGSERDFDELKACASSLVENLKNADYKEASNVISKLSKTRDSVIFNSVGRLTRALHSAIVNFNVDAKGADAVAMSDRNHMSDASDRLEYVLRLTQDAANKTMDKVEQAEPIASALRSESKALREEWSRLKRREMDIEEFAKLYYRMDAFLENIEGDSEQLSSNLQEIILEQGYQDLTGQVLKKVIGLVSEVETELVNLMRIAGQVEDIAGIDSAQEVHAEQKQKPVASGEGPQINAAARDDVVNSQDEVDDLLSSLGF